MSVAFVNADSIFTKNSTIQAELHLLEISYKHTWDE